jgi:hypothetical protein
MTTEHASPPPRTRSRRRLGVEESGRRKETNMTENTATAALSAQQAQASGLTTSRAEDQIRRPAEADCRPQSSESRPIRRSLRALAKGGLRRPGRRAGRRGGKTVPKAVFEITTHDVASAGDIFRAVYDSTGGRDGRVSIEEVEPGFAHDAAATSTQAKQLWAKVDSSERDDQDSRDGRGSRKRSPKRSVRGSASM